MINFFSFATSALTSYEGSLTLSEWSPKLELIFRNLHNVRLVFLKVLPQNFLQMLWGTTIMFPFIFFFASPLKYTPANISTEICGVEGTVVLHTNLQLLHTLTVTREKKVCLRMSFVGQRQIIISVSLEGKLYFLLELMNYCHCACTLEKEK